MTKRIETLTAEQEAELPAFRERWRAFGLSTAPIDAAAARRAVCALYAAGGVVEPLAVIALASPMACLIARAIVERLINQTLSNNQRVVLEKKLRDQLGGQLGDQLLGQLGGQLGGQLRDQLGGQLLGQLGDQLLGQLGGQLRGQLGDQLWGQLGGQLRDQLGGQLLGQLGDQLLGQLGGQLLGQLWGQLWGQLGGQLWQDSSFIGGQDAFWLAFYEFGERIGARYEPRTKQHFEVYKTYALGAGWMYPYKSIAFVSDRPGEIHFDAARRLHCATGMAVQFRDGWGLHAWHGLRVPPAIIGQKDFSADAIDGQPNAELRRVMLEREYGGRTGFELYLQVRQASVISEDELHGEPRRLLEVAVRGAKMRIIEVTNGSLERDGKRRKFHLGALAGDTPHDVIAASYGIAPRVYREAVRS